MRIVGFQKIFSKQAMDLNKFHIYGKVRHSYDLCQISMNFKTNRTLTAIVIIRSGSESVWPHLSKVWGRKGTDLYDLSEYQEC